MVLSRLIYVSEPRLDPADGAPISQIASIMSKSRRNNRAADITGALVYDPSWFLQVLEGDRHAIWQTYDRISEDERHDGCVIIEIVDIESRMFGNWWMGLATRDDATEPVFRPFLDRGNLRADVMKGCDVLALMVALAKLGLHREMHAAA